MLRVKEAFPTHDNLAQLRACRMCTSFAVVNVIGHWNHMLQHTFCCPLWDPVMTAGHNESE